MSSRFNTAVLWTSAVALFLTLAWSADLTFYNWWASGGPPVDHPEIYWVRGNFFFGACCGLFLVFVFVVWRLIRRDRVKTQLNKQDWEVLLRKLSAGEIPDGEIGPAIVHLSKPLDPQRIAAAKETVLRYLDHQNSWARHEAMWFIRWAGFRDENPALIKALRNDEDSDNRGYAAMCIAHLMNGTANSTSVNALKTTVLNEKEDSAVRMNAYGALIEVATKQSGSDFYIGEKGLRDVDWEWVSKLN